MRRIISISSRKGGSGKTTTAVNVSAALALKGSRVIVIDADPQAHATVSLGITPERVNMDLSSLLMDRAGIEDLSLIHI